MKKTLIGILALMMALVMLCTACGGSKTEEEPEATEAPAATELPTVTAPPQQAAEEDIVSAEDNSAPEQMTNSDWLASLSEEQRKVEEELVGGKVEDLIAALGEPERKEYSTSCLVADGEDGVFYYDGFVVMTTKFPNGDEYVMGTSAE